MWWLELGVELEGLVNEAESWYWLLYEDEDVADEDEAEEVDPDDLMLGSATSSWLDDELKK